MTKVSIKNFQSIKNIELDINGFTVLVGKNNIGKSAIIRAIIFALTNQQGTDFIRKGAKECEVTIVKDSLDLHWKKSSGAHYTINGETFSKIKGIPQPILDAGFKFVELGDQKVCPLFAEQFEPNFLLDQTGSKVAEALSAMYKLDLITLADELCLKEFRASKSLLRTREEDLAALEKQLDRFKDFGAIKEQHRNIRILEKQCEELKSQIDTLRSFEMRLEEIVKEIKRLEPVTKINIPDSKTCNQKLTRFQEIQCLHTKFIELQESIQKLSPITSLSVPSHSEADIHFKDLEIITTWATNYESLLQDITHLKKLTDIEIPRCDQAEKVISEVILLQNFEMALQQGVSATKETRDELNNIEEQLKNLKKEQAKITVCPLCKRAL